ncbi:unnamed protein product [Linum tenue]|uniref:Uncharacterized protein n=1 Tax=Linum tenue TaxID=586396 RepID=A0AAV0LE47_9ROSI|nr:unnamed protein product [Linum tenue]
MDSGNLLIVSRSIKPVRSPLLEQEVIGSEMSGNFGWSSLVEPLVGQWILRVQRGLQEDADQRIVVLHLLYS